MINDSDAFVEFDMVVRESAVKLEALSLVLGERSGILRVILADEIAKGVDVLALEAW